MILDCNKINCVQYSNMSNNHNLIYKQQMSTEIISMIVIPPESTTIPTSPQQTELLVYDNMHCLHQFQ